MVSLRNTETNINIIDESEISAVIDAGFIIVNKTQPSIDTANFINEHFRGLELQTLLSELKTTLKVAETKKMTRDIIIANDPPQLVIEIEYVDEVNLQNQLNLKRVFSFDEQGNLYVEHEYLSLPPYLRQKRIGKGILSAFMKQYEKIGVKKIKILAALEDGGYVWAKVGFKALERSEVSDILAKSFLQLDSNRFSQVKKIYDLHYLNPETKDKPFAMQDWADLKFMEGILKNTTWHGEIDLTDQKEFDNFKEYVSN